MTALVGSGAREAARQEIVAVVGVSRNGVIGRDGAIPWRSSVDMKHFKNITTGHPVVMGRRTFDSIGKLLPNRLNVILTRDKNFVVEGAVVVHSRREALKRLSECSKIMIIGGDQIYKEFYRDLTRVEMTEIGVTAEGDAFFNLDPSRDWKILNSRQEFDQKLGSLLEFRTYIPDTSDDKYLKSDVKELLRLFGSGEPIPGSGAAAALQALLAAYLVLTVVKISSEKQSQAGNLRTLAQFSFRISSYIAPRLRALYLEDIAVFGEVVPLRKQRDKSIKQNKAAITRRINRRMSEATAIPDQVAGLATELLQMGEFLYERGYQVVRGDSGASISAALSSLLSCSFVMTLNARTLARSGGESWAEQAAIRQREAMAAVGRISRYLATDHVADPAQMAFKLQ